MINLALTMLVSTMLAGTGLAMPTIQQRNYTLTTVHQFPNNTWIENMAIRSNGQILGTNLDGGNVFLIDPKLPQSSKPPVVASFGETTAVTGITEVEDDVFYVQGVRNSTALAFQFPANASAVWRIDMRSYAYTGHAEVSKVADTPKIGLPNGMTLLSKQQGTVLIADSYLGKIWRFCVKTGHYETAIDLPVLKPVSGMLPPFGVNGLKVIGSKLYFSNLNQGLVGTFQIRPDGQATSSAHIISSNTPDADDFAVGPDGSIWLAENIPNTLVRVFPDGQTVVVAGGQNSTELIGPVSARFGRTPKDQHILYVSTDGLVFGAGHTLVRSDGKVVALDTRA